MAIVAKLKIQLLVEDQVVAESKDSALWQKVLHAITITDSEPSKDAPPLADEDVLEGLEGDKTREKVEKLASELSVPVDMVVGACSPTTEPPYLHLDDHQWEAFKKNTPKRGSGAVAPLPFALTALAVWFKCAGLGHPTQAQGREVLKTIGLTDRNPVRGIKNTEWLQQRGENIVLKADAISKGVKVLKAYCLKSPLEDKK